MVNMSARNLAELKQLCRDSGRSLKDATYYAMSELARELRNNIEGRKDPFICHRIHLSLGLGDELALKFFSQKYFEGHKNLANVAGYVLRLALSHPAVVTAWMEALVKYCEAEDVNQSRFLEASVYSRREYRRVKVKGVAS